MEFDFTGVNPRNPLVSFNPEPGPYECKITSVDPAYNGGNSTKFEMDAIVGPSAGMTLSKYVGNTAGEKGGNKAAWLGALAALTSANGGDPDAFIAKAKQGMKFTPETQAEQTFMGKKIHVLVIEVPGSDAQGRTNLPNVEFVTKAQYEQLRAAAASGSKPAPVAKASPNGAVTPTQTRPPTPTAAPAAGGDVLAGLFGTPS